MSRRTPTAPPPPEPRPVGPAPGWGLWQRARGIAPTAIVAGAFIGIACWNVIAEDPRPASAVATGGATGPRTNQIAFHDTPERAAHEEALSALQKMRDADRAFVAAIEETLEETRRSPQAAAQEAKHQEAMWRTAAESEAERQAAARDVNQQAEEAIRQAAAREAKRHAEEGAQQAASQEAQRQPLEAAAKLVPTSPEPEGAPGLLVKVRSGETLQTLYLRVYRGLTPPPFESVAALNPERVRPGDILIFPTPVNGWAERKGAEAVPGIR